MSLRCRLQPSCLMASLLAVVATGLTLAVLVAPAPAGPCGRPQARQADADAGRGRAQASRTGATGARATNPVLSLAENPQAW